MMNSGIQYKKALVTGAGRGLGAALCKRLIADSVDVVALNRSRQPLEDLVSSLGEKNISPYYADVTAFDDLEQTLRQILDEHPDIDLAILNAGLDRPQRIEAFDWRIARAQIDTNLTANYVFVSTLVPHLLASGGGRIAIVSSLGSYAGCPYEHAYNASKAGARMLADGLRAELVDRPVAVSGIYPGFIATEMIAGNAFDSSGAMAVDEAAAIVVNGLREGKDEILFPEPLLEVVKQIRNLDVAQRIEAARSVMAQDFNSN